MLEGAISFWLCLNHGSQLLLAEAPLPWAAYSNMIPHRIGWHPIFSYHPPPPLAGSSSLALAQSYPWTPSACRHLTSHPQLWFCTALLFPALPKVHSDGRGGPLNFPQSLVIMLGMLNLLILFMQPCKTKWGTVRIVRICVHCFRKEGRSCAGKLLQTMYSDKPTKKGLSR